MILVDYDKFFEKRFDIVLRYYILEESNWDIPKSEIMSKNGFIKYAFQKMPLGSKILFNKTSYEWISKNLTDIWLKENPYIIYGSNNGTSVKRFLITIKNKKELWWKIENKNVKNKLWWEKSRWMKILESKDYNKLIESENKLIKIMKDNNFFHKDYLLIGETKQKEKIKININKTKLAMIIWQSGEKYIKNIIDSINKNYKIINIIRHPAIPQKEFEERMMYLYTKIDPSKISGVKKKLKENGDKTSFLIVLCKGNPNNNSNLKRKIIRPMTGVNCIHSTDSEKETYDTLKYLNECDDKEINELYTGKEKSFNNIKDFLHKDIIINKQKIKIINNIDNVWKSIKHLNYVTVTFGPTIKDDVSNGKDIEFISDNRSAIVDCLNGRYGKSESVYIIRIKERKVKIDNCLTFMIPEKWKNKILKTRVFNKEENCYMPTNIDRFWIHVYDRTILKPMKFKNSKRYGSGEQWDNLILFGQKNGIKVNNKMTIEQMKKLVNGYIKKI